MPEAIAQVAAGEETRTTSSTSVSTLMEHTQPGAHDGWASGTRLWTKWELQQTRMAQTRMTRRTHREMVSVESRTWGCTPQPGHAIRGAPRASDEAVATTWRRWAAHARRLVHKDTARWVPLALQWRHA